MIEIDGLVRRYPRTSRPAVDGVSVTVPEGTFFTLLGSSGCGKSTTLRCIAGLERPDAGEIRIAGKTVFSGRENIHVPAFRRKLGMVFQSYAIWPHMTVRDNVAYPLSNLPQRPSKAETSERVRSALRLVGMDHLIDRSAPLLSGGEQQRVALARALITNPSVLLLDEPLSNLDAKLREQMRTELRDLQRRLQLTMIYVTHDQDEAFALSDLMAIMSEGQIVELDTPAEMYRAARTQFGSEFIGNSTRIPGRVSAHLSDGKVLVKTDAGEIVCLSRDGLEDNDEVAVYVRPEDLSLEGPERGSDPDQRHLQATVTRIAYLGRSVEWWAEANGITLRGLYLPNTRDRSLSGEDVGQPVVLTVGLARCLRI